MRVARHNGGSSATAWRHRKDSFMAPDATLAGCKPILAAP